MWYFLSRSLAIRRGFAVESLYLSLDKHHVSLAAGFEDEVRIVHWMINRE